MTHLYDSNGSPVVGWEKAEQGETELQRFRRRYQSGRCVVCGAARRWGRKAICKPCWDSGARYCLRCERIIAVSEYDFYAACCRRCDTARHVMNAGDKGHGGRVAGAIHREKGIRRAWVVYGLVNRAWSWEEIARHPDVRCPTPKAAEVMYRRHLRKGTFND